MANNIELLNHEDAKDTKEEPPHPPRQFHYQKNQDFVGVVPLCLPLTSEAIYWHCSDRARTRRHRPYKK